MNAVSRFSLIAALGLVCAGCSAPPAGDAPPIHIAELMPLPPALGATPTSLPATRWAVDAVNAAGGIDGRELVVDLYDENGLTPEQITAKARAIAHDDRYVAVLGGGSAEGVFLIADELVAARKPLVNYTSTAADVLRAYAGGGYVWRTRQADVAQSELLVRFAQAEGMKRVALVASLDANGTSFFDWLPFFAEELGYGGALAVAPMAPHGPCDAAVAQALAKSPDMLFAAPGDPTQADCVAQATLAARKNGLRVVYADAGLDPNGLWRDLGPAAVGIEGFSTSGDAAFEQAFHAYLDGRPLPPHGASQYDAVLLLAYGLAASHGRGGAALAEGIASAVSARDPESYDWRPDGVAAALAAIAAGRRPALVGASGALEFEPQLLVDLVASRLTHYTVAAQGLVLGKQYWTGCPELESSAAPIPRAGASHESDLSKDAGWAPAKAKSDAWAVIAALSSGWANYRHQSDALRQYQALKAAGFADDHIVLILAGDVAGAAQNPTPGKVVNEHAGPNVAAGIEVDYGLGLSAADFVDILTGVESARTPKVVHATAGSNLYVYLVGHGGSSGMPIGAADAGAGLAGKGELVSPSLLRGALCSLRAQDRLRRAFVVVETCHGGAFGEAALGGIELGCGDPGSPTPLGGVALMSGANAKESSLAAEYDASVGAWLSDAFSHAYAAAAKPGSAIGALYANVYLHVPASHVSLYNAAQAGHVGEVQLAEFLSP